MSRSSWTWTSSPQSAGGPRAGEIGGGTRSAKRSRNSGRRELDDAVGSRPRELPRATRADPVGRLVPGQDVTDATDAAVWAADHGEPLQCEWRPGARAQQVFEGLTIDTHVGR